MFESISQFVASNIGAIASLIALGLVLSAYYSQTRFRLWVRDFWVNAWWIGDLAKLSKDQTGGNNGWLRSEEKLCSIYKPYVNLMTKRIFDQRIEYLRKSADLGRTPTPLLIWILLVVLVIAEGLGFSYLLGSWMAREGSPATHTLLMFAIVLVLCVIMVALTHHAGHQYYRTSLLRSCFARFKDLGTSEYAVETVSLSKDQSQDDSAPEFKQIVNRVAKHSHDTGSYAAGIIAIVAILFIGVGSTYMRVKNLEGEESRQSAVMEASAENPFAKPSLPAAVTEAQNQADAKAQKEAKDATHDEGLAAFAMLGFIFVITQIVGMGAGYKYGFAARESHKAFESLGGFSTYEDYLAYFQPLRDLANSRLKDLQQRIEEKAHIKMKLEKSFDDFLLEQKRKADDTDTEWNDPHVKTNPKPAVSPAPESHSTAEPPASPIAPTSEDIGAIKAKIVSLNDPAAEKAYFVSLPAAVKTNPALQAWLKERKTQREAEAQVNADELF